MDKKESFDSSNSSRLFFARFVGESTLSNAFNFVSIMLDPVFDRGVPGVAISWG
jgi:hypothetical protein